MSDASPSSGSLDPLEARATGASDGGRPSRAADLAYSTLYGGALGGSAIAIFFLILDFVRGSPLFTPSLLGTALFTGADPATVTDVRLDMVAFFSLVHLAAFVALGWVTSWAYLALRPLQGRTAGLAALAFGLLTLTLLAADALLMPGVVAVVGIVSVLAANAVTAWVMASFIARALAHRIA